MTEDRTVAKLLRQQAALAHFGSFAFGQIDLQKVLSEAARICAESLGAPFSKICRYRTAENDLLVVAGYGWEDGVVGHVVSQADESSTQGRAFVTGEPVILEDIRTSNSYALPDFYRSHGIVSTVDVLIKGANGPFGVLEADCSEQHTFDEHNINFLTGFANVVAEAVNLSERDALLRTTIREMQALMMEKDALLEERNMLSVELQHRVRNNLQLVYGMLVRQIDAPGHDKQEGIRAIARRVTALGTVYDHLLGHGLAQTINFDSYLKSLCTSLKNFQGDDARDIEILCETEAMELDLDLVTTLGIIVTEITSNSFLHAFKDMQGIIRVSLIAGVDLGRLVIADNGSGFTEQATSERQGIGLIKRLMAQEKGTANLQSTPDTTWTLVFPIKRNCPKSLTS